MNNNKIEHILKKLIFSDNGALLIIKSIYNNCTKEIDDFTRCNNEQCPFCTYYGKEEIKRCCIFVDGAKRAILIRGVDLLIDKNTQKKEP